MLAKHLPDRFAEKTRVVKPGDAAGISFLKLGNAIRKFYHDSCDIVARNERRIGLDRPIAVRCEQIGWANRSPSP